MHTDESLDEAGSGVLGAEAVAGSVSGEPAAAADAQAGQDAGADANGGMGTLLEPVLRRACEGRLSEVTWFRTDWQRGGAVTGYALFDDEREVVVKLPVPPCERRWLIALQPQDDQPAVAPRVYAQSEALNGYDLAWVVMERLPHGPLGRGWGGRAFDLVAEAAARFYAAAEQHPVQGQARNLDWADILRRSRQAVRDRHLPNAQRWSAALKRTQKKLKAWVQQWEARGCAHWCHGDLHPGNAMMRDEAGPAVLLDFACTRPGHWIEDAVYFEHLYWGREHRLEGRKLCKLIAQQRRAQGLSVEADWAELAQAKRALLALSAPLRHLGEAADDTHMQAALKVLERSVN